MIKRVFLSSINYDHEQRGLIDAFSKVFGAGQIQHFDYLQEQRNGKSLPEVNERFLAAARAWNPDFVFLQVQETNVLQASTLARLKKILPKTVTAHWMGDCRTTVSPYLASICREAHLTLISSVGQTGMFMEAGAKEVRYLQIGLDWEEDVMGNPPWDPPFRVPQVVFCGGYYGNLYEGTVERVAAIMALRNAGIDIGIVGNGWPSGFPVVGTCGVKQQHHIWKRCRVALNVNHFQRIQNYFSDRQIISMASGKPLVCHYIPGLENEFEHGKHLLWYYDEAELVRHVKTLLADPGLAARIGAAGRAEVLKNHTWEARVRDVLPDVERIKASL
jgi:hypothetical protein